MSAETNPGTYPGNPSLPKEVKEKILSTFRHTLNLFHEGKLDDCIIGCDFILKMDARFSPGRQLLEKARNPAAAVDIAQLEQIVATTPTRQERVVAADPDRLLVRAVESFNARDFDATIAAAQQVLQVLPGNQDAREILDKATRKRNSQPIFDDSRQRAVAALDAERPEDARRELEKMRALDPDHPAVAILERRVGPAPAPAGAPAPKGTVAKAVPPPPPDFGGLDLDLPDDGSSSSAGPSFSGFGAASSEPEIRFDDGATVAIKMPPSFSTPAASPREPGGLDALSLDALSLDLPASHAEVPGSRGLGGPLQDSAPAPVAAAPGSPADLWNEGTGLQLEEPEPEPPPYVPPAMPRPSAVASSPAATPSDEEESEASEREIAALLRQGDDAAARGDRQQAIEVWSRIFLIDINNTDAVTRIEGARQEMADGNRVISDGLKAGKDAFESGDLAAARELFLRVLAVDENEPTARFNLDRIEEQLAEAHAVPGDASGPPPVVEPPAGSRAGAATAKAASKSVRIALPPRVLAMVGIFAALVAVLVYFFVLRAPRAASRTSAAGPGASAQPRGGPGTLARARELLGGGKIAEARSELRRIPPSSPDREEAQRMLGELGKAGPADAGAPVAAAPGVAPAGPSGPVAAAGGPDPGSARLRLAGEKALAEKRYIDALKTFSQASPAFRNDPTFAQSMGLASEKVTALTPAVKLYNEGEYETAIPVLWRILQEDRENQDAKSYLFRAYFNQGVTQLQNGQYPKAIESFGEALTIEPNDTEASRHRKFAERYQKADLDLMGRIYVRHLNHRP